MDGWRWGRQWDILLWASGFAQENYKIIQGRQFNLVKRDEREKVCAEVNDVKNRTRKVQQNTIIQVRKANRQFISQKNMKFDGFKIHTVLRVWGMQTDMSFLAQNLTFRYQFNKGHVLKTTLQ